MSYHEPIVEIRRVGVEARTDAALLAQGIVDAYAAGFTHADDRSLALDAVLRDLARLRRRDPTLDGFITSLETYIDGLHRELIRRAA